jgi:hypothetical protein
VKQNLNEPVTEKFPDLSAFIVIQRHDGTYLLGAGALADGLIVPLFPDLDSAYEVIESLSGESANPDLQPEKLGNPFNAMRKAAGEGAAGFQFSVGSFNESQAEAVFSITQGRVIFPFMTRYAEAGSQWPTVLGSALLCDEGCYLTRKGVVRFGSHDLLQWIRYDIFDRASAKLSEVQPFRSHNPTEPFWCLAHDEESVSFYDGKNWYQPSGSAIVLFGKDICVGPFTPPEGYYPVFTSEEAARGFLEGRLGGAFNIVIRQSGSNINDVPVYHSVMSSELGQNGQLRAAIFQVDNLVTHLAHIADRFRLPPWSSFVINPAGHREDIAWGRFPDRTGDSLEITSVGATWRITTNHECLNLSRFDQFMGHDTFFFGAMEYRFSDLGRTLGRYVPVVDGEDLRGRTSLEIKEILQEHLFEINPHDDFWVSRHISAFEPLRLYADTSHDAEQNFTEYGFEEAVLSEKWVLNFWNTVDGEKHGPFYFSGPIDLASALCRLEVEDRSARIDGRGGPDAIGFEGSGNMSLESAIGNGFQQAIFQICMRFIDRGYKPSDAFDMAAAANRIFKNYRISLCGNTADILVSHIPSAARSTTQLFEELGIDPDCSEAMLASLNANLDPEGESLIVDKIGATAYASLLPRTKLFLSTALLQFENLGRSPCLDYAPVSVQIVKALEYEIRELASHLVSGFIGRRPENPSREEETLFYVRENQRDKVSLGSLTYAIKSLKSPVTPISKYAAARLREAGLVSMTDRSTWRLILEDVLRRYRNGGAHEHAISYTTCDACIKDLIGSSDRPGLVIRVATWRQSVRQ